MPDKSDVPVAGIGGVLGSMSGPSTTKAPDNIGIETDVSDALVKKVSGQQELAQKIPANPNKTNEYGDDARCPMMGFTEPLPSSETGASTASELIASDKVGDGGAVPGVNATITTLDRLRVDSTDQPLTTNQGVPIGNNQHSLKSGLRGPTLLEDFILREKITHFDHERIPERVVHARGSAAHGYFEAYKDLGDVTIAAPFREVGKRTPVFVRFSTVAGERGSTDTARDVRGFAVKFYTEDGNWDLVGNNIPVFFIQDAMKFPDLVHAVKPEPNHAMPQASSAHDTYWDFVSLMPETAHMLMWQMSDRAIPRSYRMMQGFGVHTFRLVNQQGNSVFCKFHWTPLAGAHSLVWDEAVKISGADPDFHRRDLWEAIESGAFPEWELGLQIFTEENAQTFPFDVLDPTKIVPEELVPLTPVGRLVLNRNPDNFFTETEQAAFCVAHIIPGIDFSNDPLLQGRIHSYVDTQLTRLGGANFHEIPINSPIAQVHNNQRDGMHRKAIHRGRVNYEPNSLAGGCPFQAGMAGFRSFPEHIEEDKVRGNPVLFADHYSQARLFWNSQSIAEQNHIIAAFRFELSRVQIVGIRLRVVALLANVNSRLAESVVHGLGLETPPPLPLANSIPMPEYVPSPALSLLSYPSQIGIKARRIAILVAPGVNIISARFIYTALLNKGAIPRFVATRLGTISNDADEAINADISLEAGPSVFYDGVVIPDGDTSVAFLLRNALAVDFVREQYRHCKPILAIGDGMNLILDAGIPLILPTGEPDNALIEAEPGDVVDAMVRFEQVLVGHREFIRETDPPVV